MILNSRVISPVMRLPSATTKMRTMKVVSFSVASNDYRINTEQLRIQLEQLHAEAEIARSKANNARLRLMRLSEAAENLQSRAATKVVVGKECEAREMLIQKKKLMQALEKSKNRIEVLDKLSAKINEAISKKETQLIGNVAMPPEVTRENSLHEIRFIHPKDVTDKDPNKTDDFDPDCTKSGDTRNLTVQNCEANLPADWKQPIIEEAASSDILSDDTLISSLKGISSYEDFLGSVDEQLKEVETDLVEFLRFSTLILENEQTHKNSKVRETSEILKDVRRIRGRIASITKNKLDDS